MRPLLFRRFGNCHVALADDGTLYVVTYFCGAWVAYYQRTYMPDPEVVSRRYPSSIVARRAANEHSQETYDRRMARRHVGTFTARTDAR